MARGPEGLCDRVRREILWLRIGRESATCELVRSPGAPGTTTGDSPAVALYGDFLRSGDCDAVGDSPCAHRRLRRGGIVECASGSRRQASGSGMVVRVSIDGAHSLARPNRTPMASRPRANHSSHVPSPSMPAGAAQVSCPPRKTDRARPCSGHQVGRRALDCRPRQGRDGGPREDGAQPITAPTRPERRSAFGLLACYLDHMYSGA